MARNGGLNWNTLDEGTRERLLALNPELAAELAPPTPVVIERGTLVLPEMKAVDWEAINRIVEYDIARFHREHDKLEEVRKRNQELEKQSVNTHRHSISPVWLAVGITLFILVLIV